MITVACVWVKGNVPYSAEYVARLQSMVARHLSREHRFCCLTDRPKQLPSGVEPIEIASPHPLAGWWSKVQLFNPALPLKGRVLYLDLDTLVVRDLAPIVDYPAPFALVPHEGNFKGMRGRAVVKRFNSSVMAWDVGSFGMAALHWTWTPAVAKRLHGDQDWIGEQCPGAAVMPQSWFPRLSSIGEGGEVPAAARVVLSKKPKNFEAAAQWPWFNALWRAA